MFSIENDPVSARELERFAHRVATAVDRIGFDPATYDMVVGVDDRDDALLLPGGPHCREATLAELDQLLATPRRMAALVSLIGWSPNQAPVRPAWFVVAVGRGGLPAVHCVRRIEEDDGWTLLNVDQCPWFALATASGLRASLEQGLPLRLKQASSAELYRRPDEEPEPPLDEHGAL